MSGIVRFLSIAGMIVHGILFLASLGASGLSDSGSERGVTLIFFFMPFIYFAYCFTTSFRSFEWPLMLPVGILVHLIIIPFYVRAIQDGIGIISIAPLILAPCWFRMYFQRKRG